jgi:2-polyprenyl-6-methoxyphenol hydroxylase-like FAD-dependent oxidoreductase
MTAAARAAAAFFGGAGGGGSDGQDGGGGGGGSSLAPSGATVQADAEHGDGFTQFSWDPPGSQPCPPPQAVSNVSVTANPQPAVEGGADGGFVFTRTGDTAGAITVGYSATGTAVSGTDYTPLTSAVIPAGPSSVTVPVHALADSPADDGGRAFILINRGEHWQCGYVIPKGGLEQLQARGLLAFRHAVAELAPFAADRVSEIAGWDEVPLLSVRIDRLRRWYRPGLLFIGDAAHAMSPVGGVGINLAIQDAVATANLLRRPLLERRVAIEDLRRVQRRRERPTRVTQRLQIQIQNRGLRPVVNGTNAGPPRAARVLAALTKLPALARLNGRLIGLGIRPEHVQLQNR